MSINKIVATLKRAARVFVFGAIATVGLVTYQAPQVWTELATTLNVMALAGIWGGIVALLAGADKWLRWEE